MIDRDDQTAAEKNVPSYDLLPQQVQLLTDELLADRSESVPGQYRYIAVEVAGDSKFANVGRHIERTVFEAAFGNDAQAMTQEYGPYEDASAFYISIDRQTQKATGVLRVIKNSEAGLKTLNDAEGEPFRIELQEAQKHPGMDDLEKVWDVGTIAVLPEHRGNSGPVSILLERAMYVSAMDHGTQALVSIVDHSPLVKMRSKWRGVGIPFKNLAGSKSQPYLGSKKSHAVFGYVPEFYEKMSKHRESLRGRLIAKYALGDALDRLVEGTADEAIVLDDGYKNNTA